MNTHDCPLSNVDVHIQWFGAGRQRASAPDRGGQRRRRGVDRLEVLGVCGFAKLLKRGVHGAAGSTRVPHTVPNPFQRGHIGQHQFRVAVGDIDRLLGRQQRQPATSTSISRAYNQPQIQVVLCDAQRRGLRGLPVFFTRGAVERIEINLHLRFQ